MRTVNENDEIFIATAQDDDSIVRLRTLDVDTIRTFKEKGIRTIGELKTEYRRDITFSAFGISDADVGILQNIMAKLSA